MRIVLEFSSSAGKLHLPLHYNSLIQGLIYRNLDRSLSDKEPCEVRGIYDAGLGSKSPQGFGMVEVLRDAGTT